MSTDKNKLKKGLNYLFGALPLFFISPVLLNIGFSAIKKDQNYLFIALGSITAIGALFIFAFGIKIILGALFSSK